MKRAKALTLFNDVGRFVHLHPIRVTVESIYQLLLCWRSLTSFISLKVQLL